MIKVLKKVTKNELKDFLYSINTEDDSLYTVLEKEPVGIFQFSGGTARNVTRQVKPENFEDMVAINAFARPGTIDFLPQYLDNKRTDTAFYASKINDILKSTHGTVIFQEQAMSVFNKIGGFTLEETNYVRGLMKKLGKADKKQEDIDRWNEVIKKFEAGAKENGLSISQSKQIADDMLAMSSYSFNRSHAVAYSYVALMTMYMSFYFQKYFYSSIIEYTMDNKREDVPGLLRIIRNSGYEVMPPDLNKSKAKTYADGNSIFIGLHNLKQIGDSADIIIKNRPYNSFIDFIVKNLSESKINKRSISTLVKFGCFDELEPELNRRQMNSAFADFWDNKKSIKKTDDLRTLIESGKDLVDILNENKKIEDLVSTWNTYKNAWKKNDFVPVTTDYLKGLEVESLGFNYFISPFSKKEMEVFREGERRCVLKLSFDDIDMKDVTWKVPVFIESLRLHTDRNGNKMAFITIEDTTGMATSIPVFASFWQFLSDKISTNSIALFSLYRNKENQIMFGTNRFIKDASKIKSFVMPIKRRED